MSITNSLYFLIFTIVIIYISKKLYHCIVNPLFAVCGIFGIAGTLFFASDFINHDLSVKTILVISLSNFMFILGLLFGHRFNLSFSKSEIKVNTGDIKKPVYGRFEKKTHYNIVKLSAFIMFTYLIFQIWYIVFVVGVSNYFNFVYTSVDEILIKNIFGKLIAYFKMSLIVLSPMCLDYAIRYNEKKKLCYGLSALSILLSVEYSRSMLFYLCILFILVLYFHTRSNIRLHKSRFKIFFVIFIIAALTTTFLINSQTDMNKQTKVIGKVAGITMPNGVILVLEYFMATIKSTDIYISMNLPSVPLAATLREFLVLLGIDTSNYVSVPFVDVPFKFNTALASYYLYREGGFLWLALASFIIGILSDYIFRRYSKNDNAEMVVAKAYLFLCLIMGIRSYMPMFLSFWISLITIWLMHVRLSKARKKDLSERNVSENEC